MDIVAVKASCVGTAVTAALVSGSDYNTVLNTLVGRFGRCLSLHALTRHEFMVQLVAPHACIDLQGVMILSV